MSRKRQNRKLKPKLLFLVEGETEKAYFEALAQHYRLTAAKTVKILDNNGNDWLDKAKNMLKNNSKLTPDEQTRVFIIFDSNNENEHQLIKIIKKATN